jgi:hypothetical protein
MRVLAAGMQCMLSKQDRLDKMFVEHGLSTNNAGFQADLHDMDVSQECRALQPFFTNKYWSKSDHVHDMTIEMPPPPDEDHLERSGGARKRHCALDQREVMRVEEPEHGIPRPLLLDVNNNSKKALNS